MFTIVIAVCCIISSFYIKPQLEIINKCYKICCIISSFYIKPQLSDDLNGELRVVLYLHSTSNHNCLVVVIRWQKVVLYLHSTSNHNCDKELSATRGVVLYLHSTSNHNRGSFISVRNLLYYIFILHQTTTIGMQIPNSMSCIISSFYIKPQQD